MSMHKKPLTVIEEAGLIAHMMGRDIGKPSIGADIFRVGVEWGMMAPEKRVEAIKELVAHGLPVNDDLRLRLTVLVGELGA